MALTISYLLRVTLGGAFIPEMGAQTLITLTPASVESVAVENLRSLAKYSAFTGGVILTLVLYGLIGMFFVRSKRLSKASGRAEEVLVSSSVAYLILVAIGAVFLSLTQIQTSPVSVPNLLVSLIPAQVAFGAIFIWLKGPPPSPPLQPADVGKAVVSKSVSKRKGAYDRRRRLIVRTGVAAAVGAAILAYGVSLLLKPSMRSGVPASSSYFLSQEVTPTSNFYRVDVNIFPPSIDGSTWSLPVTGLVNTPLQLNLSDLQQMSVVEQYNTLECVSNPIGGNLMGTAQWTGVHLKDVLNMAGVQASADYVVFKAVDGYSVGIPLDRAMLEGTLLAYEINGQPLPAEHGYPLRAIVPGLYGMMNCKWITSIEVVSGVYEGYWQQRGWENDAMYNTASTVVIPGAAQLTSVFNIDGVNELPLSVIPVAGVAFAGDRGISKVEVSTDGGNTWTTASLTEPLSNYTWVFWTAEWNPPATGTYQISVRATDGEGNLQTAVMSQPFPDGATGYQAVDIEILPAVPSSSSSSSS